MPKSLRELMIELSGRDIHTPAPPRKQTEAEQKYWDEVRELQARKNEPVVLSAAQVMQSAINRGNKILGCRGKTMILDAENQGLFDSLALYFARDDKFSGDLNKGIMLTGDVGRGKSFPLRCFAGINSPVSFPPNMIASSLDVISRYQSSGPAGIVEYERDVLMLDELSEIHDAMYYGNKMNIIQYLIEVRYNYYIRTGKVTHTTTNIKGWDAIESHYGKRVSSRFEEMFNIIKVTGKDRRKI